MGSFSGEGHNPLLVLQTSVILGTTPGTDYETTEKLELEEYVFYNYYYIDGEPKQYSILLTNFVL